MIKIPMVDLKAQYAELEDEIDAKLKETLSSAQFIKGPEVREFENALSDHLNIKHVISCANGTDAIQLALMALDLKQGDEIITPAFSYIAATEVAHIMGFKPIFTDVDLLTFDMVLEGLEAQITERTKAMIPVHLFGQCNNMQAIMEFANKHDLYVIEDNAQSIGSMFDNGVLKGMAGSFGHISTTSFFPSKNLGAYGDGGAVMTQDDELANKLRMMSSHGQREKYIHELPGLNSRLDSIQAAILNIKLRHLDRFTARRRQLADHYDKALASIQQIRTPQTGEHVTHVYHQYTIRVLNGQRDELRSYLSNEGVASAIYYPMPCYEQKAYQKLVPKGFSLPQSKQLSQEVLSLPICSHTSDSSVYTVSSLINKFFNT